MVANTVSNAADTASNVASSAFSAIKSVNKVITFGLPLAFPFFFAAAGTAIAAGAATNASVWTAFYKPLFTSLDGTTGLGAGLGKITDGARALFKSGFNVASAGFNAGPEGVIASMGNALNAPLNLG